MGNCPNKERKRRTCTQSFTCILCINFHVVYILPTGTTGGWGTGFFNYKRLALGTFLTKAYWFRGWPERRQHCVLWGKPRFSFWVICYVTFLDVNECSIPDICPANFECKNLKFTYKCECRGGFKYQIKEKGKNKECVGEFWRIILIKLGKIIYILLKIKKGRYKESTIRGHRKKLSHRRDSKLRPYAVRKSNPKRVTLLALANESSVLNG